VTVTEIVRVKRDQILAIARKHGASNVRLFGSAARGDADEDSDIDLLVDLERGRTLFDLAALIDELNEVTGCRVDVVTEHGLRDRLHDTIISEAVAL
jgi:predicted nucleotidyltransferase